MLNYKPKENEMDLRKKIEHAINSSSAENGSNTPDFILAEYLTDCLAAFDKAAKAREAWYGIRSVPGEGTVSLRVGGEAVTTVRP